jgi:hypothetical protein
MGIIVKKKGVWDWDSDIDLSAQFSDRGCECQTDGELAFTGRCEYG